MHLQRVQRLLRLVNRIHHEFVYLPVDKDMGSASVVIGVLELTVLSCVVVLLILLIHIVRWLSTISTVWMCREI